MTIIKISAIRYFSIILTLVVLITCMGCDEEIPPAPILILASDDDFGTFTGEMLRTEGYKEYEIMSLFSDDITAPFLLKHDIVILAQKVTGSAKGEVLRDFVNKGGNLIAFKPDFFLSDIFGITPLEGTISEGYIGIDTSVKEGRGLTSETLQFHGDADIYGVNRGRIIAALFTDSFTKSEYPALISCDYGKGKAYAFTYNLPESIIYTRQGNPSFAGIEKDGINGLRAMDLFTDGWLDTSKNTLNQADIQMNLLSHCIEAIAENRKPLPRLWYFPDALKSLVTLTNDGEYRSETDFEAQFSDIDSAGAKMTLYILETDKVSKEWVDKWTANGFEISGHPDNTKEAGSPAWLNMNNALSMKKKEISDLYGIEMKTIVNHWFVWCGVDSAGNPEFAAQAKIEAGHGLELDINYAHYDNGSNQGHFLGSQGFTHGNFTGSGLVMKFATSKGEILDIYQHLNNVYDQQYNENNDPEGFFNCFKGLMDRSLNDEAYTFISVKAHNDEYYFSKDPLMKMIQYSKKNGIPVWTALKLIDFIKMRDEASFSNTIWSNNSLSFSLISSLKHSNGLTITVPNSFRNKKITGITKNGNDVSFIVREVKGLDYAFLTVEAGAKYSMVIRYGE